MPIQKIGMEWPSRVTNADDVIDHGRLRRTAARMPSGMPRPAPTMIANVASSIVAGMTWAMSLMTGWPVRIDTPKSPVQDVARDSARTVRRAAGPAPMPFGNHVVGGCVCLLADDGADRIDRHQPADAEGKDQKAEQGRQISCAACLACRRYRRSLRHPEHLLRLPGCGRMPRPDAAAARSDDSARLGDRAEVGSTRTD